MNVLRFISMVHSTSPRTRALMRFEWLCLPLPQVCAAITTKLADSSKTKAIQFGALHRKLQQRSVISEPGRKAALHCLYLCAGRAGPLPSVVQLSAPAAAPAPPSPGASLMDSTGQLRARVRAPAPGALPSAGAAQAYWGGVPEAAVLQEILYAVQGIEGQYVLLDPISDAFCITEEARVPRGTKDIVRQVDRGPLPPSHPFVPRSECRACVRTGRLSRARPERCACVRSVTRRFSRSRDT